MKKYLTMLLVGILVISATLTSLSSTVKATVTFQSSNNSHIPMINYYNWFDGTRSSPRYPHVAGYMYMLYPTQYWAVQQVRVTCCFPNTPDPSVIGNNNWLAAGMFLQGQDHIAESQDYGFYDVIVIDNTGAFYLDVGVWMDKEFEYTRTLLFQKTWLIQGLSYQTPIRLNMFWDTGPSKTIYWTVTANGQTISPPGNYFDIGAARPNDSPIKGFYVGEVWEQFPPVFPIWVWHVRYFQFGITSPQLIQQSGWEADVSYPQYANTTSWDDVAYAESVEGLNAWLDYDFHWGGEEFTGVNIAASQHNLAFSYTGTTIGDDVLLWHPQTGGGGCPYVATWNGTGYALDNNILPASELGNGTDVKDYYKIEQPLVPVLVTQRTSTYRLQIQEFEDEKDYIDQVKLISVDHTFHTSIATTSNGDVITYGNAASPSLCYDNHNVSRLDETRMMDGNVSDPSTYFEGYIDDWLLLNFGNITSSAANLILRDDWKCMDVCINVQVPDGNGIWQTVEVLHPRSFWSMEAVNMTAYIPSSGNFTIRLLWTAPHRLDYVGLDTSAQDQIQVHAVSPKLAVRSNLGNVTADLLYDDETCVELVNGQMLTMKFELPNRPTGMKRDFILFTNGYYYNITPQY